MNVASIISIIEAALPLLSAAVSGGAKKDVDIAANLLKIIQTANAEYQAHTGKPIDPSVLQPIDKV